MDQVGRLLVIKGEFEPSDDPMRLVAEYAQFQPTLITFDSNGGSVVAAMKMGRAIRALNVNTIQIRSSQCASACALAFLGGVKRSAEAGSIGVHQAFFSDDVGVDQKTAVATVQALTGEIIGYLSDMGVSAKLLQLSLSIESSDMRYLTSAEMREWGIVTVDAAPAAAQAGFVSVVPAPGSSSSPPSEQAANLPAASSPADRAVEFVRRYHDAWSDGNSTALTFMRGAYEDQVDFYGKVVGRDVIIKEKTTFAQRWPERIYSLKSGSESVRCAENCNVSGVVEWFARSRERAKTSSGMAEFSFVWNPTSGKIESESGKVLATDKGAKAPDRVINQWHVENSKCRGSTNADSPKTQQACKRREEVGAMLDRIGWCYGHKEEYGYQMRWHVCDANSNRPQ
ncbi:hypothetical protein [Rhizobium rhizosphaerae]|uniref:COG3904 family protein n=1 Tax=Xaviernesmea rhizosphaerae TaxID=1672749 RepID=UPI001FD984EE|nr:hypothetical protein [Xaviernesmea rhizosphaerae]